MRVDARGVAELCGVAGGFGCGVGGVFVYGIMIVVVIKILVVIIIRVFPRWIRKGAAAEAELDERLQGREAGAGDAD